MKTSIVRLGPTRPLSRQETHLSLDKDTPIPRPVTPPSDGAVVAIPDVGDRHHRYDWRAA